MQVFWLLFTLPGYMSAGGTSREVIYSCIYPDWRERLNKLNTISSQEKLQRINLFPALLYNQKSPRTAFTF